ncbi:MAG: isocitrate/isopropylmalate dehydrogenase family protein, partial [Clostridia bacterium]|nr:isocitrate/isopropylmalate dehydrogenase family protein [Clostridia bacterium]
MTSGNYENEIKAASAAYEKLLRSLLERVERINAARDFIDYEKLDRLVIGVCGGDGIGPVITGAARKALEYLLSDDIKAGKIEIRDINGLTIENRVAHMQAIPDDVMEELLRCHVILKGPTTTPRAGDPWPNI